MHTWQRKALCLGHNPSSDGQSSTRRAETKTKTAQCCRGRPCEAPESAVRRRSGGCSGAWRRRRVPRLWSAHRCLGSRVRDVKPAARGIAEAQLLMPGETGLAALCQ